MNVIYCRALRRHSSRSRLRSQRIPFRRLGFSEKAERFNIHRFLQVPRHHHGCQTHTYQPRCGGGGLREEARGEVRVKGRSFSVALPVNSPDEKSGGGVGVFTNSHLGVMLSFSPSPLLSQLLSSSDTIFFIYLFFVCRSRLRRSSVSNMCTQLCDGANRRGSISMPLTSVGAKKPVSLARRSQISLKV